MSREQYSPPTLQQGGSSTTNPSAGAGAPSSSSATGTGTGGGPTNIYGANAGGTGVFNITGSGMEDTSRPVQYLCSQCDAKVSLKARDVIRCKDCGGRVLYKERTNRMVQFTAR